jgi:hypothetical protein
MRILHNSDMSLVQDHMLIYSIIPQEKNASDASSPETE